MTPPKFLARYRNVLREKGGAAVCTVPTILERDEKYTLYYTPFEKVNDQAKLVLVGITPGGNQLSEAYTMAGHLIRDGFSDDEVLQRVKETTTFSGAPMRVNLHKLIKTYRINELIGVRNPASLWHDAAHLLHATSIVPHAAFFGEKNFAGGFTQVRKSPVLWRSFIRDFVSSLSNLPSDARFLALGPNPQEALEWCVENEHLAPEQILGSVPHPSPAGGSRTRVFVGERRIDEIDEGDPVSHEVTKLQGQARQLQATVSTLLELEGAETATPWGIDFTAEPPETPKPKHAAAAKQPTGAKRLNSRRDDAFSDIKATLEGAGYQRTTGTQKVTQFVHSGTGRTVYVDRQVKGIELYVHPSDTDRAKMASSGLTVQRLRYAKNSNLKDFPRGGTTGQHYGFKVGFERLADFRQFLDHFGQSGHWAA